MGAGPETLRVLLSPLLKERVERVDEIALTGHLAEIGVAFSVARELSGRVRECLAQGVFPIVLSGNCIAAVGTIAGCGCATTDVVWFDGHGEGMTPETTSSGFLDGMGISMLLGRSWQTMTRSIPGFEPVTGSHILLLGGHDCEPAEIALLNEVGVERMGTLDAVKRSRVLGKKANDGVYLHLDLDVLDSREARSNDFATADGWAVEDVIDAVRVIQSRRPIKALGIASYNPGADHNGRAAQTIVRIVEMVTECAP
jgi:arginase